MILARKPMGREQITGTIILFCLLILASTIIGIRFFNVNVTNIVLVDQGLYTVVTNKGPVNITPNDIFRIERTYTKAAITGTPIELDKVYTDKGFIYVSSLEPFAKTGHELANSVDSYSHSTWVKPNTNLKTIQPYAYAIGTPRKYIPLLSILMSLQYLALSIGGFALLILIFPFRWREYPSETTNMVQQDVQTTEEQFGVVAK